MATKRHKRHKKTEPSVSVSVLLVAFCGKTSACVFAVHALFVVAAHALPSSKPADEIPPLAPPLPEIQPAFWEQHAVLLGACVFVALALIGFALWLLLRPRPAQPVPPELVARNELAKLAALPETGDVLSHTSQTLRRYVAAAFNLPPGEMNTAEFCAAVREHAGIGPEVSTAFGEFLRGCDERKFSPTPAPNPLASVGRALALVELAEARRAALRQQVQAVQKNDSSEAI